MLNLLECTPIAQFAIGLDHRVTFWNKACELLTGMSARDMVGTDRQWEPFYDHPRPVLADLIVDNDFDRFKALYQDKNPARSAIVPHAWEASDFFENLGDKPRYIYFLAAPIFDHDSVLVGAIETLQDITEQQEPTGPTTPQPSAARPPHRAPAASFGRSNPNCLAMTCPRCLTSPQEVMRSQQLPATAGPEPSSRPPPPLSPHLPWPSSISTPSPSSSAKFSTG